MALLTISEPGQNQEELPSQRKLALGIDLGTTNSLVATHLQCLDGYKVETLPDAQQKHLLPSVVRYLADGSIIVGHEAQASATEDSHNTIASVKRLMGRGLADINYELPYELITDQNSGMPLIRTCVGDLSPVVVSAEILKKLAERGEQALGAKADGVVITVPAYFDEAQRQATKDAAKIANLNVLRLLSEPTAAAVAYGLDSKLEGTIIVYDFGGGTFDVSLMKLQKGVFEVLATGGNAALGGDDFDRKIVEWLIAQTGIKTPLTSKQLSHFSKVAREAKHGLTEKLEIELSLEGWSGKLTREIFNALVDDLIEQTIKACRRVLRDAGVSIAEISDVVMVGGSTRSPGVQDKVAEFFQRDLLMTIDPEKVVAIGAALQADVLVGNKYGDDMLLLDVIPLSLGIETMGGLMEKIIPRNTTIPVARAQEFTTFKDGQTIMSLHVLQGERELVSECRSLARFDLKGIPPMVAGAARIRVTFQVDADGLMEVNAQELGSGIESSIVVKPSFGLAETEVERMIKSSYEQAQNDKEIRALREKQVEGLRIVEALEAALTSDGQSILKDEEYQELVDGVKGLKAVLETDDADLIERLSVELNEASVEFAARRMDTQIKAALAGKSLEEIDK
ncbi:Fe-S protein assembly chaperone HscA [Gammaproteobacteria bacterium]|nr:Fe-S protein assembly chaperone HscA [Gammaproteobacteria bacterium]